MATKKTKVASKTAIPDPKTDSKKASPRKIRKAPASGKPFFLYIEPAYRNIFKSHLREIWEGHPACAEIFFL